MDSDDKTLCGSFLAIAMVLAACLGEPPTQNGSSMPGAALQHPLGDHLHPRLQRRRDQSPERHHGLRGAGGHLHRGRQEAVRRAGAHRQRARLVVPRERVPLRFRATKKSAYMGEQSEAAADSAAASLCLCGQRLGPTGSPRTAAASAAVAPPLPRRSRPGPLPAHAGSGGWPGEQVFRAPDAWAPLPTWPSPVLPPPGLPHEPQ